jgi:hypothetical protein
MSFSPKMKMLVIALFTSIASFAQTTLTVGDIAIIGFNTDDPDQFLFVPLVDLSAGTQIKFTDNGWSGTALTTNEGTFTWTATAAVNKGTVVSVNPTSISFSTSGDQVFAYQGAATAPVFIFGLSTRAWVTGSISQNTSRRPASLTTGTTAIAFSTEVDNGFYNQVANVGTKAQHLANIGNVSKWTRNNTRYSSFPAWTFTFDSAVSTEPAANPTNLVFSGVTTYQGTAAFTAATGAPAGYIVIRSENAPLTSLPVDGTTYTLGQSIGNGKVCSIGTATTISQKGWRANATYFFTALSYIGSGAGINYRQATPLSGSITTPANMESTYYNTVDPSASNFITQLQSRIQAPYTKVSYDLYDETMVAQYEFRDTTGAQRVQECAYSGQIYTYTPPFVWYTTSPFSREHTWCVSWMPSGGSTGLNEYADQHHLFTVNQNNANGVRSNHPLGEVVTPTSTYLQGMLGLDANGNLVYEPRDAQKGDAARALLYMTLRYNGINGFNWTFNQLNNVILPALNEDPQDLQTLINWHFSDLPDNYEIAKNDFIQSIQQNRNPFVDRPEWVNLINFNTLTAAAAPGMVMNYEEDETLYNLSVYPNPSEDILWFNLPVSETAQLRIFDMTGRIVSNELIQTEGQRVMSIQTNEYTSGAYILEISTDNHHQAVRWIKN